MKTFKCDFGSGLACEVTVADTPPVKGQSHIQNVAWTGKPHPAVLRPYIAWMNSVNQTLADEWQVTITHVFQLSRDFSKVEVWTYAPGNPPKRVKS